MTITISVSHIAKSVTQRGLCIKSELQANDWSVKIEQT